MKRSVAGLVFAVAFLFAPTALQLHAQTPTPTPAPGTTTEPDSGRSDSTSPAPTVTPSSLSPPRNAVLNSALDGDSFHLTFTDNGQAATVHLANVDAPESVARVECFGRESAAYAARLVRKMRHVSVFTLGEVKDGEVSGYLATPSGSLLNELIVMFGYGRFRGDVRTLFTQGVQESQRKAESGKAGLWGACGETEAPKPCFVFAAGKMDGASRRTLDERHPELSGLQVNLLNVSYDPVRHELIALWHIWADRASKGLRMRERYSLTDCQRSGTEIFEYGRAEGER